jgi:hypothetical protein
MRQVTEQEYITARNALDLYKAYCAPFVQSNGWTVIPADAIRPYFNGAELTTDAINAFSTNVELFELARDKPERFCNYIVPGSNVTTWQGEVIGRVVHSGAWHVNNFGGRWRQVTIRTDWNQCYTGREFDSHHLVRFRKVKG